MRRRSGSAPATGGSASRRAAARPWQARGKDSGWEQLDLPDHAVALVAVLERLRRMGHASLLLAVGHRIVHGGSLYREPVRIGPEVVDVLNGLVTVDPNHMPQALSAVEATAREFPSVPQVACFDTAFHARMPRVARLFALPRALSDEGILRYGFHGLSYEYVMDELRRIDPRAAEGRVIIAHLGNGASMAAVRGGVGIDTTMGFTPTGGLAMGTRSGDLDPGVLIHLLRSRRMEVDVLDALVNEESGLLGVSGTTSDMRDLLAREGEDRRAAEAVDLFCYVAKKHLGALVAALGGLDTLVFTGGIGEHAAPVRERICAGLGFLGVALDPDATRKRGRRLRGGQPGHRPGYAHRRESDGRPSHEKANLAEGVNDVPFRGDRIQRRPRRRDRSASRHGRKEGAPSRPTSSTRSTATGARPTT